jgi:hypothetical protein
MTAFRPHAIFRQKKLLSDYIFSARRCGRSKREKKSLSDYIFCAREDRVVARSA